MKKTNKVLLAILLIGMTITFGIRKSFSKVTEKDGKEYKTITTVQVYTPSSTLEKLESLFVALMIKRQYVIRKMYYG